MAEAVEEGGDSSAGVLLVDLVGVVDDGGSSVVGLSHAELLVLGAEQVSSLGHVLVDVEADAFLGLGHLALLHDPLDDFVAHVSFLLVVDLGFLALRLLPDGHCHDGTGSCVGVICGQVSVLDFGLQSIFSVELLDLSLKSPHGVYVLEDSGITHSVTGSDQTST